MTKVSRWVLDQQKEKELLNQLWIAITLLEDKKEVINFLKALLMPSESLMLAKRIDLVKLHDSGIQISDIRKLLHITKVTAYKWKDRFDLYHHEFKVIIDRLKELERENLEKELQKSNSIKSHKRSPHLRKDIEDIINTLSVRYRKAKKRKSAVS